jgi:hypothetical protein
VSGDHIDGYEATMQLHAERPDLIPLLRECLSARTVDDVFCVSMNPANADGLRELERRGLIEAVSTHSERTA